MDDAEVVLRVHGIRKAFGGLMVLDDVGFTVRRGQVCAVIGPNGAGKSTLFDIVGGVTAPDAGSVEFCGADVTLLRPEQRAARGMARTFQELRLFESLSAFENLAVPALNAAGSGLLSIVLGFPAERAARRSAHAMAEALLDRLRLRHRRNVAAGALSHGEKRLLEIGRALALKPRLLILDEPTSGLNAPNKRLFVETVLPALREGVDAVVIIEHDMDVVMTVSDNVIVLAHGRKIAEGAPAGVQRNADVVREYFGT
ncbi:MAG: ABC transporter ATP-binding protein [Burkholderiaceae bacterium]